MREYTLTTDPALTQEWEDLTGKVQAHTLIANRSADESVRQDAAARRDEFQGMLDELEPRIAAAARVVTVDRIHPKVWGRLVAEHPIRPDDPYDRRLGFNTDTFDGPLMTAAITSVTDLTGEEVEWDWAGLVEHMSPGQYEQIIGDTLRLHMERDAVPFSRADWQARHG